MPTTSTPIAWLPASVRRIRSGSVHRLAGVGALVLVVSATADAQVPAVRRYTSADGLSHEQVARVRLDSRGFLWLATYDGVTRFDGQRFTTYTTRDGLLDPLINDVYEDRDGRLWIATNGGGAAVLRPVAPPGEPTRLFDVFKFGAGRPANRVNTFAETADGTLSARGDPRAARPSTGM